jgi:hypothetical protein
MVGKREVSHPDGDRVSTQRGAEMKYYLLILLCACAGCAELPSVRACEQIEYRRVGMEFEFHATKCRILANDSVLGAAAGMIK